jgi:hypothetical protein
VTLAGLLSYVFSFCHLVSPTNVMHHMLLLTFQHQVLIQCEYVLLAYDELNAALATTEVRRCFYALQNLLGAAANVSKACWGTQDKKFGNRRERERKPLRDSIGIKDNSPFRRVKMRNNFEHFDEKLDEWFLKSKNHIYMDLNIGPYRLAGVQPIDVFRWYDPTTKFLYFWGQEFDVQAIVDETNRLYPLIEEEIRKPHYREL